MTGQEHHRRPRHRNRRLERCKSARLSPTGPRHRPWHRERPDGRSGRQRLSRHEARRSQRHRHLFAQRARALFARCRRRSRQPRPGRAARLPTLSDGTSSKAPAPPATAGRARARSRPSRRDAIIITETNQRDSICVVALQSTRGTISSKRLTLVTSLGIFTPFQNGQNPPGK